MDTLLQDLRLAARRLARSPGFGLAAVLTLGLGVGLNTALFTLVDRILLRPLPYEDAQRLVMITRSGDVSLPDGVDWRAESRSLESIGLLLRSWAFDLTGDGPPERLDGSVAEADVFEVLGARAALGRLYTKADDVLGGERVAVVSDRLWRGRLGGDPDVVGSTLMLSDNPTTVIGVMAPGFDPFGDEVDLWVPPAVETPWAVPERGTNNFDAIGRLAPGATLEEARNELRLISERLAEAHPRTNGGKIVEPMLLHDFLVGPVERGLTLLFGAVALVLLLASVNLAGLLLVRSVAREEEFAVRAAIGAGRIRVVRQLVTEGMLLAVLGGVVGVGLAVWARAGLLALAPESLPRAAEVGLDVRIFAFAFAVAVTSGLVFSLIPAIQVLRSDPSAHLAGGRTTAGRRRQRLLGGLVAAEVALACLLLVGSGLLLRTLLSLQRNDLGFEAEGLLTAQIVLPESRYSEPAAQTRAFTGIVDRLNETPGVESAAYVIGLPLTNFGLIGHRVLVEERPVEPGQEPGARSRPVYGRYFETLRLPVLAGRAFDERDGPDAPRVAIVNESFVREHLDGDPLGQRIGFAFGEDEHWMEIVGVAADVRSFTPADGDVDAIYTPYVQRFAAWQRFGSLVVRTRAEPAAFASALQDAVWAVDPTLPVTNVRTMNEHRRAGVARERFYAIVLGCFAGLALLIAVQGLYALLAWAVEQRRREIGVRLALGASASEVAGLVTRRAARLGLGGLVAGLALAALLGRAVAGLLHGVSPLDTATYVTVALVVGLTTLVASVVPARRATRVDPAVVLREP